MTYKNDEQAKRLVIENDCGIRVTSRPNILTVSWPENVLTKPYLSPLVFNYNVEAKDKIEKTASDSNKTISIFCPDYAKRLTIITDIVVECNHRHISSNLLFSDTQQDVDILEIKNMLVEPDDLEKESLVEEMVIEMVTMLDLTDREEYSEVEDAYQVISKILINGGI